MGYSLRTERFRYTEWRDFKTGKVLARELYDHQNDSGETMNLAGHGKHAVTIKRLSKLAPPVLKR